MHDSWIVRQNERNAALPWRSRLRRAAGYAGVVWVVLVVGVFVLKYEFDVIDRPVLAVLVVSSVLAFLLFGCFIYGYWMADVTKQLHDDKHKEHDSK